MKEGLPKKPPKESKVEAPMLRDTKDPKQFAEEHGALVRERIARRLQILQEDRAARLAATSQEPKPEPVADPAAAPDALIDSSSSATTDPVKPDAVNPVSGVTAEPADMQVSRPTRRRQGGRNAQQPTPVTPAAQPTPAAMVPPVVLIPSVGDPVADPTPSPADARIADAADTAGVPDGLLDPEDALKIQNAVDAQNAQQADVAVANTASDPSLNIADPVVIVQPRRRQVNKPDPAVAAAVVAAGATVSVAAGGRIPDGIDPNSLPVLNEPLSDDFDKEYNIEGMTLAPKEGIGLALVSGEEGAFRTNDPVMPTVQVVRDGDDYYFVRSGKRGEKFSKQQIEDLARSQNWVRVEKISAEPSVLTSPETPKVETPEAEAMSEIERLKVMVGEARLQYVTTDYNQDSWWKKFKNVLGAKNLGDRNDVDTQSAFQMYTHALTEYQNAQLTEMEKEGLTPEERSKRMAGMLKFLKADEFLEMKKARHQVKLEGMTKAEKVVEAFEKVGQWYNKLPKKAKFAVSAAVFAGVAGTAMVGSPTLLAAAGGLSLCKRLVATAGLAVSANNLIEGWQEGKMKNRAASDIEEDLSIILAKDKNVESDWETQKARFEMVLEKDRNMLDARFGKLKNQDRLRRLGAWGGATALVFGASAASAAMGGGGGSTAGGAIRERLDGLGTPGSSAAVGAERVASAASAAGAPAGAASGVLGTPVTGFDASGNIPGITVPTEQVLGTEASAWGGQSIGTSLDIPQDALGLAQEVPVSREVSALLEDHKIVPDGRGLWGVLDKRLEGIPKGPGRDRMIQSLENIMRAKLDAMSPAERAAAGFPKALENGKVNLDFIKVGDTISFSKLLTPQEIQSVLDGQSVGAPSGAAQLVMQNPDGGLLNKAEIAEAKKIYAQSMAEGASKMNSEKLINQVLFDHAMDKAQAAPMVPLDQAVVHDPTQAVRDAISVEQPSLTRDLTDVREAAPLMNVVDLSSLNTPQAFADFYTEHRTEMQRTFVRIGSDVFRTPEVLREAQSHLDVSPYKYSQATLGKVQMSWVNQTLGEMRSGLTQFKYNSVRFPLHPSQMENLMRLTVAAQDPKMFGIAGRPLYNETVNDYMSRMSAYAVATGKEEKFTAFLYGRR